MIKKLFVFAHKGEAQTFIQKLGMRLVKKLVKNDELAITKQELYQNEEIYLLISGEGIFKAITHVTHLLTALPEIAEVYNFGIAGLLDNSKKENIEKIFPIGICYAHQNDNFSYQSFATNQEQNKRNLCCISASQRIKNSNSAKKLSVVADLVDREAWGIGYACHFLKRKFYCYKIISDIANETVDCFELKNKAKLFSDKLYFYMKENLDFNLDLKKKETEEENQQQNKKEISQKQNQKQKNKEKLSAEDLLKIIGENFYTSHYQKKKLENLLNLITIDDKLIWNEKEIFEMINPYFEFKEKENCKEESNKKEKNKLDKKKLNLLIQQIDELINPYKKKINQQVKKMTQELTDKKISLKVNENYQNSEMFFSFKVNNQKDYQQKILQLKSFDIKKFYQKLGFE